MKRTIITQEDIRRVNCRLMGKAPQVSLALEDEAFFAKVKRNTSPVKDSPRLREIYRVALES